MERNNQLTLHIKPDIAHCNVTLTKVALKIFMDDLDLEIEMLQGIIEPLPDDLTRYEFTVRDPKKVKTLSWFAAMVSMDAPPPTLN